MTDTIEKIVEQPQIEQSASDDAYVEDERKTIEAEAAIEKKEYFLEQEAENAPRVTAATPPATQASKNSPGIARPANWKDATMLDVERILEKDLAEVYQSLPDSAKPLFKQKGEEVADDLAKMVRSLRIELKRALQLIRDWLLTIPKVNKFFLEQEAKIKVDQLNELVEERRQEMTKPS